jgi:hypothetical protein
MRDDRRTAKELDELIERKVRVNLSSWEKRNLFDEWEQKTGVPYPKHERDCPACLRRLIKQLAKSVDVAPILVKAEKMIVHQAPKHFWHTGAGWYEFEDGTRIRGKANAEAHAIQ